MEEMRPLPPDLKEEAHLIELESMGFTIVSVAPRPLIMATLRSRQRSASVPALPLTD